VKIDRRLIAAAALAPLLLSCAKREAPPGITAEAAAAFGRVAVEGFGGSLVLDLDALRLLGFRPGEGRSAADDLVVDMGVQLLPMIAGEAKDDAESAALARAAVLLRLVAESVKGPEVRRLAVVAQVDPARTEEAADGALVLLAVKGGAPENRELLQALGASVRAVAGRDLVRTEQGRLCTTPGATGELPFQVCATAGDGLVALGTPKALDALATPPAQPAAREPGPVLRVAGRWGNVGTLDLSAEGRGALRIAGSFEPADPANVEPMEKALRAGLDALDIQAEKRRLVMARAVDEVKGAIGKDPEAPAGLKAAAAAATPERVLDPRGEYAALRQSIKVGRAGKALTMELTVPEAQVQRAARLDQGLTTVATIGVLSAIAIPNFLKYQCRAKASEGPATLRSAWNDVNLYRVEHGRPPDRLSQLGRFQSPEGRYTLCLRSGCQGPSSPEAAQACAEALAERAAGGAKGMALCAAARLEGAGLDVWVVDASGQPVNVRAGCE
jgi:type IV pilus assembly protein PilA